MADFDRLYCPVCEVAGGPEDFTTLAADPSPAYACGTCGLAFEARLSTHPAADYTSTSYDATRNAGRGGSRWARFHHDTAVAAARLAQLTPVLPTRPGRWVDVGCSNGAALALLRRRDWRVMGVESDPAAAADVTRVLGLPVMDFPAWLQVAAAEAGPADHRATVVSFFDVIEHLLDPVGVLKVAARSLAPDGLIVIEVPDLDQAGADFAGWKHRRLGPPACITRQDEWVTEHVWHFSAGSLDALRARHLPGVVPARPPSRPVAGKLQVVWKKPGVPTGPKAAQATADAGEEAAVVSAAIELLRLPEPEQAARLKALRAHSDEAYQAVTGTMAKLRDLTHTVARKGVHA